MRPAQRLNYDRQQVCSAYTHTYTNVDSPSLSHSHSCPLRNCFLRVSVWRLAPVGGQKTVVWKWVDVVVIVVEGTPIAFRMHFDH